VPHQSDRWHLSIRPMALVRSVDSTGQAGGNQQMHNEVPGSLSDSSRPWKKTTTKEQPAKKENPSQNLARQLQTSQELDSRETGQHHTSTTVTRCKSHKRLALVRLVKSTSQTGHAWAARDEQHLRINSPKSISRSSELLHRFAQDIGDSRNTSWALHSQDLVHQNLLNQEESRKSHQECL
jgi:hypothetical protein